MAQNDFVKTFDLEDLTESFWEKVVFWHVVYSSVWNEPGFLIMVTNDRKRYMIGFEDMPFDEFCLGEKINPIFLKSKGKYAVEGNGWKLNDLPSVQPKPKIRAEIETKCDRINSLASVLPYTAHREIQELLCEIMDLCKAESEDKHGK